MTRPAITDIALDGMPALVARLGFKPFASDQILSWLYKKRVASFAEMTNLSKEAREGLAERFVVDALAVAERQVAEDGTTKVLCRARDGAAIECVLIPMEEGRRTVCLSTQVGCAMGCAFCRTAGMGLVRNLTQGEIVGQLLLVMRESAAPVTNVVLMGMGEPLANVDAVDHAVTILTDPRAFDLSKRRITLSTCGLLPELERFVARHDVKIAISLVATTDAMRDRLMPINRRYPIERIMAFCRDYSHTHRNRITFEYILMHGENDTEEDAARLVALLHGVRAKVNLIPFNPFEGCSFAAPDPERVAWWDEYLFRHGIQTNVRASRGQDILAACGQLATSAGRPAE